MIQIECTVCCTLLYSVLNETSELERNILKCVKAAFVHEIY